MPTKNVRQSHSRNLKRNRSKGAVVCTGAPFQVPCYGPNPPAIAHHPGLVDGEHLITSLCVAWGSYRKPAKSPSEFRWVAGEPWEVAVGRGLFDQMWPPQKWSKYTTRDSEVMYYQHHFEVYLRYMIL